MPEVMTTAEPTTAEEADEASDAAAAGEEESEDKDTVPSIVESPRTKRLNQMGRNDSTSSHESRELSSSATDNSRYEKIVFEPEFGFTCFLL